MPEKTYDYEQLFPTTVATPEKTYDYESLFPAARAAAVPEPTYDYETLFPPQAPTFDYEKLFPTKPVPLAEPPTVAEKAYYGAIRPGGQLAYAGTRYLAVGEKMLFGLVEAPWQVAKAWEGFREKVGRPPNTQTKQLIQEQIDYWGHPEKYGFLTPMVEEYAAIEKKVRYDMGGRMAWLGAELANRGIDAAGMLTMFGLSKGYVGAPAKAIAPTALGITQVARVEAAKHVGRVGLTRFFTAQGNMTQRAETALTMMAYNMTPYIVNHAPVGLTGWHAVMADTFLNVFISTSSYMKALKDARGVPAEFLTRAAPEFLMDFIFALGTRGLSDKVFETKVGDYFNTKLNTARAMQRARATEVRGLKEGAVPAEKPIVMTKSEQRSVMKKMRAIIQVACRERAAKAEGGLAKPPLTRHDYMQLEARAFGDLEKKGSWSQDKAMAYIDAYKAEAKDKEGSSFGDLVQRAYYERWDTDVLRQHIEADYIRLMDTTRDQWKPEESTIHQNLERMMVHRPEDIKITGNPIKDMDRLVDHMADIFTRFRGLDEGTRQLAIEVDEMRGTWQQEAAKNIYHGIASKFSLSQIEAIARWMEQPTHYTKPPWKGVDEAVKYIDAIILRHAKACEQHRGEKPPDFVENRKATIMSEREELQTRLGKRIHQETRDWINQRTQELTKQEGILDNMKYIPRRILAPGTPREYVRYYGKRIGKRITTATPFLKHRYYLTREEAEAAGKKVAPLSETLGDMLYYTLYMEQIGNFIKAANENPAYSRLDKDAPANWERVNRMAMEGTVGRKYHPAMRSAIDELVYVNPRMDSNALSHAYDSLNTTAKFVVLYNPLVMSRYDIEQGLRAAGLPFLMKGPQAIKEWIKKGDVYWDAHKAGVFNKVLDYSAPASVLIRQMVDMSYKSFGLRFAEKTLDAFMHPVKAMQIFNNKTTWRIDEVLRLACYLGIKDQQVTKGMTKFGALDLANDFMAAYNKIPKATRRTLNRMIFTPSYKISMLRILGRMYRHPAQFRAQLARHHGYNLFLRYGLPPLVAALIHVKHPDETIEAWNEKGYRIVVDFKERGYQKVYAISGPMLETAKLTKRPLRDTIRYNLSAGLHMLNAVLDKAARYADPDDVKRINRFFKIGPPGFREAEVWTEQDRTTAEKFLTTLAVCFAYKRDSYKKIPDNRPLLVKALAAMDLWLDWKGEPGVDDVYDLSNHYRYYQKEILKAFKRGDRDHITKLAAEASDYFGVPFPVDYALYNALMAKKGISAEMTKAQQLTVRKNKFLRMVIQRKRRLGE